MCEVSSGFVLTIERFSPRKAVLASMLMFAPCALMASPWLEAQDPFLRSSLQLLADAQQISAPVSHYPMRWSLLGDDLNTAQSSISSVKLAQREVLHSLHSAKLNRGNRALKIVVGNEAASVSSFGQYNRDKWGVYTSYEHLANYYAFRLTSGYSDDGEAQDIRWEDSYLSLNVGHWLLSVGTLDRWWGQGWQHNLILGSYATATPDIAVSYVGENSGLGMWSAESILTKLDDSDLDYYSASRFISKPLAWFDYGLTYQVWFDDDESQEQTALDVRFILPSIDVSLIKTNILFHSLYGEFASTVNRNELGAYLIGWTGSVNVKEFTLRAVLESQQSTDHHDCDDCSLADAKYSSTREDVKSTTYALKSSWSAAIFVQTLSDYSISLRYQESEANTYLVKSSEMAYRFPALRTGMAHVGLRYDATTKSSIKQNETTVWTGLEFRF